MPNMTGGRYMAKFFEAAGVKAVFFVPTMLSRPLAEMDDISYEYQRLLDSHRGIEGTETAEIILKDCFEKAN